MAVTATDVWEGIVVAVIPETGKGGKITKTAGFFSQIDHQFSKGMLFVAPQCTFTSMRKETFEFFLYRLGK